MIGSINKSPAIRVRDLTKKFGQFTAVDGISFDVLRGEIFGFLGPNGSGKTTTIRMMLGLIEPSAGEVVILDNPSTQNSRKLRTRLGYMSQRFSLYSDLSVIQNLNFYGAAYGIPEPALSSRIDETLSLAGLVGKEHVKTSTLSGGWRQRLALGVSILHHPDIIFLDEPTAGVDPVSRRDFWKLLYDLADRGTTVFVTTHYMDEAEHCHRLGFIQEGKLVVTGSPTGIKMETFKDKILELFADDQVGAFQVIEKGLSNMSDTYSKVEFYGSSLRVISSLPHLDRKVIGILREGGFAVRKMQFVLPSLEDVFIISTSRSNTNEDGFLTKGGKNEQKN